MDPALVTGSLDFQAVRMRSLLLVLALLTPALAEPRKTLTSALRAGQCTLQCTESGRAAGAVLQAEVHNIGSQTLQLSLPEGTLFVPLKPEEQTRMVIDEELFEVPPGGQTSVPVSGVCVEYGKPVPAAGTTPQAYHVTCPAEKAPGTSWPEFLQADGIPTARFTAQHLDKIVQCSKIPDQARALQQAGKLHQDLGPRQLVTVIQRSVWTVCDGHDRTKLQQDIQTQVRKSGGTQSDEQIKELADNLWADVDLVTKDIPISSTPDEPQRQADLDIHPIQVVQEPLYEELKELIPMVAHKATCVRIFVRKTLTGIHTLKLTWIDDQGLRQDEITAELVPYGGRTWVLPLNPVLGANYATLKQKFAELSITTAPDAESDIPSEKAKIWLDSKSDTYFAYNFTYGTGRPCPSGTLTLTADLRNQAGQVVASRTETSGGDFSICHVPRPYNVVVTAARTGGGNFTGVTSQAWLAGRAADCTRQLLAVFPLAPADIALTVDPIPATGVPVIGAADKVAGPFSDARAIIKRFPSADGIFVISPSKFPTGPFGAENEGYTPAFTDVLHYVDVNLSFSSLVAAHEKGHDARLLGSGHPDGGPIRDAWDAGRHTSTRPESFTMAGRGWLMQQAKEGVSSSVNNFVEQSEYKKLLRALTDWGAI